MAIDYIIGGLQLLSAAVNVLALGAFWVTPGLRTTANRFVINLLVVNVIGCLALTPALWLHGGLTPEQMIGNVNGPVFSNSINMNKASSMPTISAPAAMPLHDRFVDSDVKMIKTLSTRLECIEQIGSQRCETVLIEQEDSVVNNNNNDDNIADKMAEIVDTTRVLNKKTNDDEVEIVEEVREEAASVVHEMKDGDSDGAILKEEMKSTDAEKASTKNILYSDCTRFWGFDLVAALGGLSVVLVVGDTWCAVTDPLRYHSRVSGLKSWILIASTWVISIIFCIASAFRSDCRLITIKITSTLQNAYWRKASVVDEQHFTESAEAISQETTEFSEIYNLIYSCTFFVVIILLPICLVCAMYWKIFSEARQNGLRMRQNGSSPLLQSALNLATVPSLPLDTGCSVIGEEEDSDGACVVTALPTMRRNSEASPHHVSINLSYSKPILMKMHAGRMNRHVYHQQHRRYLEIPKLVDTVPEYATVPSTSVGGELIHNSSVPQPMGPSTPSKGKPSERSGMIQFGSYVARSIQSPGSGDLRQAHSTPDLQRSMQAELFAARQAVADHNKKIHSTGSIHTTFPVQPPSICTPTKALSYMTSIRHRLSNASSIFKYREESRAARISVLVVIMFLISYFPYGLLVLLQGRVTFIANSSFLAVLFLLIASTSSPFIFAYRNRRVRRGVCRLFGVDAKTNERLQKQRILMRSTPHSASCREGMGNRKSSKTKFVRIDRNSAKSSSFTAPRAHVPYKHTPAAIPMATNEYIVTAFDTEFETDSFIGNPNDSGCIPNGSDNDDDDSDHVGKIIVNEYVPVDIRDKSPSAITSCQSQPLDMNEFVRLHNASSNSNNVIKHKISLLKRVCKTSRKLSNCTSDVSIEQIYYDGSCKQGPTPVNV